MYLVTRSVFLLCIFSITLFGQETLKGVSGMALMDPEAIAPEFLYVCDYKVPGDTGLMRFGILSSTSNGKYSEWVPRPVDEEDWSLVGDMGSDFEAICRIPKTNTYLVVESSYYKGKFGRLMLIEVQRSGGKVKVKALRSYQLPKDVEQIEGMVCVKPESEGKGKLLVVIGDRDGKTNDLNIRWELLDIGDDTKRSLTFADGVNFQTPYTDNMPRDITDLYLDPAGQLWCAASRDNGDQGPFRSAIYLIGQINKQRCCRVSIYDAPVKKVELEGLKVEALGAPILPGSDFTVGTDDEDFGSIFRPVKISDR